MLLVETGQMLEQEKNSQDNVRQRLVADGALLKRYIGRHATDVHEAADIYQESVVRVMEQARASIIHNPVAYAIRVARNLIFNKPRECFLNIENIEEIVCQALSPEESLNHDQKLKALRLFLASMPPMRRDVFLRRRMRGESRAQIALALNLSEEAVKKHITRALGNMQRFVDENNSAQK